MLKELESLGCINKPIVELWVFLCLSVPLSVSFSATILLSLAGIEQTGIRKVSSSQPSQKRRSRKSSRFCMDSTSTSFIMAASMQKVCSQKYS